MADTAHARVVRQALHMVGGMEQLASHLKKSPAELRSWAAGREIPRANVFFALLDIIGGRTRISDPNRSR